MSLICFFFVQISLCNLNLFMYLRYYYNNDEKAVWVSSVVTVPFQNFNWVTKLKFNSIGSLKFNLVSIVTLSSPSISQTQTDKKFLVVHCTIIDVLLNCLMIIRLQQEVPRFMYRRFATRDSMPQGSLYLILRLISPNNWYICTLWVGC